MKNNIITDGFSKMAFIKLDGKNSAAVLPSSSAGMFSYPDADPAKIKAKDKKEYELIYWGEENDLPQKIIEKVGKSHDMSSNMLFNIQLGYGNGIIPVKKSSGTTNTGEIKISYEPVLDNADINLFFENNDVTGWWLEQLTDLNYFYHGFSSVLLNKDTPDTRKIVELRHRDAAFCRHTKMNDKGIVENCLYSPLWGNSNQTETDIIAIPSLDTFNPTLDLKRKIGREIRPDTTKKDDQIFEYIIESSFPSPGRSYYNKPYWYALIESGWYDFAMAIPEFKKAILTNQMTLKYMIYFDENYFKNIFSEEGITNDKDKKIRVALEYKNIQTFLSGSKNAGKGAFGRIRYTVEGKERKDVVITPLENPFKGGEYIEDSEEVSTILAYGMGQHGSLIGSHGKTNIAGTEARELFIIKQAIQKSIRDRLLRPLYVIKAINKWPEDIYFISPNIELTTLDSGTGSKKVIS
jgi:hypothetical protein